MPVVNLALHDISQNVTRPVIQSVVIQICEYTKIPKSTKVFFPGDINMMPSAGSAENEADRTARFSSARYLFIEIEEQDDQDAIQATALSRIEHPPIFLDNELRVRFAPIYSDSQVTINFKYRTNSLNEAQFWARDMRMRVTAMRDIYLHRVQYHYLIPLSVEELIEAIHTLREARAPYGQPLGHYLKTHLTNRARIVADSVAQNKRLAIAEARTRIQGYFDFSVLPEKPQRQDDSGTYEIGFSYKFSYDKPLGLNLRFPIMVHNQLLDPKYTQADLSNKDFTQLEGIRSMSVDAMREFEIATAVNRAYKQYQPIRIPSFDDFTTEYVDKGLSEVLTVLCQASDDPRLLFNLQDLKDHYIDPDILSFIAQQEHNYITKPYGSIIQAELFIDDKRAAMSECIVKPNLDVVCAKDIDLRKTYRVRISVVNDFSRLPRESLRRLCLDPKACTRILAGANEVLRYSPNFVSLYGQKRLEAYQLTEIFFLISGQGAGMSGSLELSAVWLHEQLKLLKDIPIPVIKNMLASRRMQKTQLATAVLVCDLADIK